MPGSLGVHEKVVLVLQSCRNNQAPPFFCTHHLNEYGPLPPVPLAVNVTVAVVEFRAIRRNGALIDAILAIIARQDADLTHTGAAATIPPPAPAR